MGSWYCSEVLVCFQINKHISRSAHASFKFFLYLGLEPEAQSNAFHPTLLFNPRGSIIIIKSCCWRERPAPEKWTLESASSDCRAFLSHMDLLSAVEMLRHKGCLNTRIFGWSISVFVDAWSMTALCMSAWIPENWWMLQSDGLFLVETQSSAGIGPARMCL